MKRSFSSLGMYSIVEAQIDESQVNGAGGHFAPRLMIPFFLSIHHGGMQPLEGIIFRTLRAKLCVGQNQWISAASTDLRTLITKDYPNTSEHLYLEFPLDAGRVSLLENLRNGGDLKVRIEAVLSADQLWELNAQREVAGPHFWSYRQSHQLHLQEDITFPRDAWVSRVLPQVGYGTIYLLEFPAAKVESHSALKASFDSLAQAQERHRIGLYDDAAGKCRIALEPFFVLVEEDDGNGGKKKVPRLKTSWETKLGKATYEWLNGTLNAIKLATNSLHHSPSARYGQMESQVILSVTAAVVAYAARMLGTDDNP